MRFPSEMARRLRGLALLAIPITVPYAQNIKTGPNIGQQVPMFSAKDQEGRTRSLKSIMGPKGAMIIFVRSADW